MRPPTFQSDAVRGGRKGHAFEGDGRAMRPPTFRSDAVLSCPGCFSIVCLDCQVPFA
ncbi:hypothetical protein T484DRAFT_1798699 [Baffinella frigidus]|nr:hypothetical protein T484DRAFT_1798699 [Cryptophyta sp. CCMP2293]